jgi:hypothetical protein
VDSTNVIEGLRRLALGVVLVVCVALLGACGAPTLGVDDAGAAQRSGAGYAHLGMGDSDPNSSDLGPDSVVGQDVLPSLQSDGADANLSDGPGVHPLRDAGSHPLADVGGEEPIPGLSDAQEVKCVLPEGGAAIVSEHG